MKGIFSVFAVLVVAVLICGILGIGNVDASAAGATMQQLNNHLLAWPALGGIILNRSILDDVFKAYNEAYNEGFQYAKPLWKLLATDVPSTSRETHYAWLGTYPRLREWIGDREVTSLAAHDYSIKNRKFEATVGVPRDDIEDDVWGVYTPLVRDIGHTAATHPDELLWELLKAGTNTFCWDGQYFFDTDHPVDGASVSNVDSSGADNYWYLLDASRPIRPLIFQRRRDYAFRTATNLDDESVVTTDEFLYGIDSRVNVGYGFWQQAYASNQTLDSVMLEAAMDAMMAFKSSDGRPLGIMPTHLVVGASNRSRAVATIYSQRAPDGADNPYYQTVQLVVSPYLP